MTPVAVCCIMGDVEQWTEQQVISFVRENGFPTFNERKLKRYRAEGLVQVQVAHPGFGGTSTSYSPETGPRSVLISQFLQQKRNYHVVRFRFWLSGHSIEIGLLKESIWQLVPISSWQTPTTLKERRFFAKKLAQKILNATWKSVHSNLARKILQQFDTPDDQSWYLHIHTQLFYGVPVDFRRVFLDEANDDGKDELEEPADFFAHGLQAQRVRILPTDLSPDLQRLSDEQLLSFARLHPALFTATEEALVLARARMEMVEHMWETLDLLGQLSKPMRLFRALFASPGLQAWFFIFLLLLEQHHYGPNLDLIGEAVRINLPIIKRGLAVRKALQQELPSLANELIDPSRLTRLWTEGTQKERDAHLEHIRALYRQHKEDLDAFWECHAEWKEE